MPSLRSLAAVVFATIAFGSPGLARADDGVDHAFDIQRRPGQWNSASLLMAPVLTGFDPGDPQVGVTLLLAYAPSPLMIVEQVSRELETRPFDIVQLIMASVGTVASTWGFAESFDRPLDIGLGIESLATAHALSWNLQLLMGAVARLVLGRSADQIGQVAPPMFIPFTVDGGGGVSAQWLN